MTKRKTKEERLIEVLDIRCKLKNLGFNHTHDEVKRLFDVLSEYVNNGDYRKEKFVITGYDRVIEVVLYPREFAENVVRIRTVKDRFKDSNNNDSQVSQKNDRNSDIPI